MNVSFLAELHCPYCSGRLELEQLLTGREDDIEHGIVRCICYRYPLIDGIVVLKQQSGPADTRDVRVQHLQAGDFDSARSAAMGLAGPADSRGGGLLTRVEWARRSLSRLVHSHSARPAGEVAVRNLQDPGLQITLQRWRPDMYGEYLYHRYANNSFHASVPLLLLLGDLGTRGPAHRVLELACGIGHSAFLMGATFPNLEIVATDHDFTNLWIAKRFFSPNARLICLDAEVPLPFSAGGFSAVFCLDGFHYVRSKIALGREILRVATSDALFLFPHLHNALQRNIHPGIPLTAASYQRCFEGIPSIVFDEETVLRGFVNSGELALDHAEPAQRIERASSFALVATRREGFWCKREDLAAPLYADATKLIPNPLYALTAGRGFVDLRANWPNTTLEAECRAVKEYLPEALRLESTLLERLQGSGGTGVHDADLRSLVQRFALVRLPAAYAGQWQAALDSLGRAR